MSVPPPAPAISAYEAFARAELQLHEACRLSTQPGEVAAGLGLLTTTSLDPETVLFSIPRPLCLTPKTSGIRKELRAFFKQQAAGSSSSAASAAPPPGWAPLMLAMLHESDLGGASPWAAYLQALPDFRQAECAALGGWPHQWPAAQRQQLLRGTGVAAEVARDLEQMALAFHAHAQPFLEAHAGLFTRGCDLRTWQNLGLVVMGYSFTDELSGDTMMVPLADALNHRPGCNNARLFFEDERLDMVTVRSVEPGAELFNTYGDLGNAQLLRQHGFVEPNNPEDTVLFGLEDMAAAAAEILASLPLSSAAAAPSPPLEAREAKLEWLEERGLLDADGAFAVGRAAELPRELLQAAAVLVADAPTIARLAQDSDFTAEGTDDEDEEEGGARSKERGEEEELVETLAQARRAVRAMLPGEDNCALAEHLVVQAVQVLQRVAQQHLAELAPPLDGADSARLAVCRELRRGLAAVWERIVAARLAPLAEEIAQTALSARVGWMPTHVHVSFSLESGARARAFEAAATDVFVVTAPKTGTTWLTQVAHQARALAGGAGAEGDLDFADSYQVVPWDQMAWDLGQDLAAAQRYAPPRVFKSHQRLSSINRGGRYVVLLRAPAAVAQSYYDFLCSKNVPRATRCADADAFVCAAAEDGGFCGTMGFGATLWEYYAEFAQCLGLANVLCLVYEDLASSDAGLAAALPGIVRFLGLDPAQMPPGWVAQLVRLCGREFMAAHSSKFDESWTHKELQRLGRCRDADSFQPATRVRTGARRAGGLSARAEAVLAREWARTVEPACGCKSYEELCALVRGG